MYALTPISCNPCSPCNVGSCVTINIGGSGTGGGVCSPPGDVRPEGSVVGSPGCIYNFTDGTEYEIWFKQTGELTPYGWVLWFKFL